MSHCFVYLSPRWKFPPNSAVIWPDSLVKPHYGRCHSYHVVQATCFCCQGLLPPLLAHRNLLDRFTVSAHLESLLFTLRITLRKSLRVCLHWSLNVRCMQRKEEESKNLLLTPHEKLFQVIFSPLLLYTCLRWTLFYSLSLSPGWFSMRESRQICLSFPTCAH